MGNNKIFRLNFGILILDDECWYVYTISYSNDSSSDNSSSTWDENFQAQWQDYLVRHGLDLG